MSPLFPGLELEVPWEVKTACPMAVASRPAQLLQNILQRKCHQTWSGS